MDLFHSHFVNKIDRKGRVSVPADFRQVLQRRGSAAVVLWPSVYDDAVDGAGEDHLAELHGRIESLDPFSRERDDLLDAIMSKMSRQNFDSEGRIMLPEALIAYAGLSEAVTFVGRGKSFQIWNPEAWTRRADDARARLRARRNGGAA